MNGSTDVTSALDCMDMSLFKCQLPYLRAETIYDSPMWNSMSSFEFPKYKNAETIVRHILDTYQTLVRPVLDTC